MEAITTSSQNPSPPEAAPLPTISEHIGVRPGYCGGKPHILGHRIKVEHVAIWHEKMGMSPAEIVEHYPTITLSDVHAALAYYYDHRDEIEADIREGDEFVEKLRAGAPSLIDELRARKADATDDPVSP